MCLTLNDIIKLQNNIQSRYLWTARFARESLQNKEHLLIFHGEEKVFYIAMIRFQYLSTYLSVINPEGK